METILQMLQHMHVNGTYEDADNNLLPSPQDKWLKPAQNFTTLGKEYLDTALLLAAVCSRYCPTAIMNPHVMYYRPNR